MLIVDGLSVGESMTASGPGAASAFMQRMAATAALLPLVAGFQLQADWRHPFPSRKRLLHALSDHSRMFSQLWVLGLAAGS